MKILFLLKKNNLYSTYSPVLKSGLYNSARMTAEAISSFAETKVVICRDANSIDKEISLYKPDLVIVEAIWVTKEKFLELRKLYPTLPFIVRVHSEIPFLSNEGEAITRIISYQQVSLLWTAFNSLETFANFSSIIDNANYFPNIYEAIKREHISFRELMDYYICNKSLPNYGYFNIAGFGAIRPLKNQLLQAFAAIEFGERNKTWVRYFINSARIEQGGESTLKNIRALFAAHPTHQLIELPWMEREEFLESIGGMDLGLQLSFSESFNIVTADFVKQKVPILVSTAIEWMPKQCQTSSGDVIELAKQMERLISNESYITKLSSNALSYYNEQALTHWKLLN